MKTPRTLAMLFALGSIACSTSLSPDQQPLRGSVTLTRGSDDASSLITGAFLSVIDTVTVSVTGAGDPLIATRQVGRNQTSINFPVTLSAGATTVTAKGISNRGTLLFTGSASATVDHDGFSITVQTVVQRPVLVLVADTVRTDSASLRSGRFGTITVHNSGIDGLTFTIARDTTNTGQRCGPNLSSCTVTPNSGKLGANQDATITFRMPTTLPTGAPLPGGFFNYVVTSPEGTLVIQWRYPASG